MAGDCKIQANTKHTSWTLSEDDNLLNTMQSINNSNKKSSKVKVEALLLVLGTGKNLLFWSGIRRNILYWITGHCWTLVLSQCPFKLQNLHQRIRQTQLTTTNIERSRRFCMNLMRIPNFKRKQVKACQEITFKPSYIWRNHTNFARQWNLSRLSTLWMTADSIHETENF